MSKKVSLFYVAVLAVIALGCGSQPQSEQSNSWKQKIVDGTTVTSSLFYAKGREEAVQIISLIGGSETVDQAMTRHVEVTNWLQENKWHTWSFPMNVKPEPSILAWMVLNNPAGGGKTKTDITLRHVGENRKFVEASVSNNLPKDKYFAELAKRLEDLRVRAAVTPKRK